MQSPEAESEIRTLVTAFYARVREDELLGPVFEARIDDRWEPHLDRMCHFWSSVLHATGRYRGDPLGVHARLPDLTPEHFDRWMALFEETARDVLTPWRALDVVARAARMRLVLEKAC